MKDITHDIALETLLKAREQCAPEVPEKLVRDVYEIQRKYQFDYGTDRNPCIQEVQRLIENYASSIS